MARTKIDPSISRKAYALATKRLKEEHAGEFMDLLDAAYNECGEESPRQRSIRRQAEANERKHSRAAAQEEKRLAKIAAAKALLEEAGLTVSE